MKVCLCKRCDTVDVTTLCDFEYRMYLCVCCSGLRREPRSEH